MSRALRAVLCLAIVAVPARSHVSAVAARSLSANPITQGGRVDRQPFRLGDAAAPFGWSTVVADFDTDGRPDVAVADRLGSGSPAGLGNEYRLEFSIAGRAPHDVTFESSQDAVTISVADVDRDNDLDVVVEMPLSGEAVGVWLNDGHGNFTEGDVREFPAAMRPLQSFKDTTGAPPRVVALDSTPRPADQALPSAGRTSDPRLGHRSLARQPIAFRSARSLDRSTPRAPPATASDLLS